MGKGIYINLNLIEINQGTKDLIYLSRYKVFLYFSPFIRIT